MEQQNYKIGLDKKNFKGLRHNSHYRAFLLEKSRFIFVL